MSWQTFPALCHPMTMGMYLFVFSYLTHYSLHKENITQLLWNEDGRCNLWPKTLLYYTS